MSMWVPDMEAFYSTLRNESISLANYAHAKLSCVSVQPAFNGPTIPPRDQVLPVNHTPREVSTPVPEPTG